jgi:endonuclease VIII
MPEGDTIHRAAAALRRALAGEELTRVDLPRIAPPHPRVGARVTRVEARGKHLLMRTSDGLVIHTHLRMTGSWHLYRPGERWHKAPGAARVILATRRTVAVCFAAPIVEVLDDRGVRRHPSLRRLGPDLLDPEHDLDEVLRRLGSLVPDDRTVGEVLLDQRVACGIGNVYRCDILFLHALAPDTPVGEVDEDTRRSLYTTAARLLRANVDATSRTTVDAAPAGSLWVHGRAGAPCRRCGTPIATTRLGEQARYVYWCPTCQPRRQRAPAA